MTDQYPDHLRGESGLPEHADRERGRLVHDGAPALLVLKTALDRLEAERDDLIVAANSARVLIERHRATRGSSQLLATALQELDGVLPTYQEGR